MPRLGVQGLQSGRMSFKLTSISFSFLLLFLVFLNFTEENQVSLERCFEAWQSLPGLRTTCGWGRASNHSFPISPAAVFRVFVCWFRSSSCFLWAWKGVHQAGCIVLPLFLNPFSIREKVPQYLWLEHHGYQGHKFSFLQPPWKGQPGLFS